MPASAKHPIAIALSATKIRTRKGGSITKNRTAPLRNASTHATSANTMLTRRNWSIAIHCPVRWAGARVAAVAATPRSAAQPVDAVEGGVLVAFGQRRVVENGIDEILDLAARR